MFPGLEILSLRLDSAHAVPLDMHAFGPNNDLSNAH